MSRLAAKISPLSIGRCGVLRIFNEIDKRTVRGNRSSVAVDKSLNGRSRFDAGSKRESTRLIRSYRFPRTLPKRGTIVDQNKFVTVCEMNLVRATLDARICQHRSREVL